MEHKLEKKGISFSTEIEFLEAYPVEWNPMITKVKVRIARPGRGNQYFFTKETLENAAKTSLGLTPIVAYYNHYTEDFGEHGEQAVYDRTGEFVTIGTTKALGVIPENPVFFWDVDDYLVVEGYLWTTYYKEAAKALIGRPQSMELSEEHTIMRPLGNGQVEIIETAFQSLCILGADVKPAFENAEISGTGMHFTKKDQSDIDNVNEGVERFMKDLNFALQHSTEEADLIVDVDGEERDLKNREKITDAIDTLDDVAEASEDPENVAIIDDAITLLVDAEMEMKREADIIPASKAAQKALQGVVDDKETILSTEELSYASKKKTSLIQPSEEEQEGENTVAVEKKKVIEEEEKPVVAQEQEEIVVEKEAKEVEEATVVAEEEAPSEPEADEAGTGEPETDPEQPETPEGDTEGTVPTDEGGEFIQAGSAEETTAEIGVKRQTAASKRTSNLLSELGDAEIYEALVERIQATEEMKTTLSSLLGGAITNELPGEGEVPIAGAKASIEDLGNGEEKGVELPEGEADAETVEEDAIEEEVAPVEDKEVIAEEEDSPTEEVEEEEAAPTEEVEEEKKKKKTPPNFSFEFEAQAQSLRSEIEKLKAENAELLFFKQETEKVKKEQVLNSFNISEEAKEGIRLNFNKLSISEVEEKAIVAEYKETKEKASGQKQAAEVIVFSSVEEEVAFTPGSQKQSPEDALRAFLEYSATLSK